MDFQKLTNDTLKSPAGRWSLKRIMSLVIFNIVLFLTAYIILSDMILEREINRYAIDALNSLLLFEFSLLGLTEATKKIMNRAPRDESNDDLGCETPKFPHKKDKDEENLPME